MPFTDQDKKDLKNSDRTAIAYETQESNPKEAPGWKGSLAALADAAVEKVLAGIETKLADLLYTRIADGVYEQLVKWQAEEGFGPDPKPKA